MNIGEIPAISAAGNVHVLVEIPKGAHNKYELDEELGVLRLDRALHSAVYYPTEYGFVPGTRSADGERLDGLVLVDEPTFPGCLIETRAIGAMTIELSSGGHEHKLLCVPVKEPRFAEYEDVAHVPGHVLKEIEHFFDVFKELEERPVRSRGWMAAREAREVLTEAIRAFREERGRSAAT